MGKMAKWMVLIAATGVLGTAAEEREPEYLLDVLKSGGGIQLAPGVDLGLLLEIEAFYNDGGSDESDIALATVEAGIDAALMPGLSAQVVFLYEEGENDDDIAVDVGSVTVEAELFGWDVPLYLKAGKDYVPFGVFNSSLISDPLTLELAETQETLVQMGWEGEAVGFFAGAFNGDADAVGSGNHNSDWFAGFSITPHERVRGGVYIISDIAEGGLEDAVNTLGGYDNEKAGAGFWVSFNPVDPLTLDFEYITTRGHFDRAAMGLTSDMRPSAWNAEAAYALSDPLTLAVRVEGSDDIFDDTGVEAAPELRYGVGASYGVNEFLTLSLEYLRSQNDGAEDDNTVTAQIAVEF